MAGRIRISSLHLYQRYCTHIMSGHSRSPGEGSSSRSPGEGSSSRSPGEGSSSRSPGECSSSWSSGEWSSSGSSNQDGRPRRPICDSNNPFNILTPEEFLQKFRLSKGTVGVVLYYLQSSSHLTDKFPLHLQLLSTLTYYNTGHCEAAEAMLGVNRRTVKHIISKVSKGICDSLRDRYLSFPDNQQLAAFQEEFYNIGQISRVIGCIVSTYVPVKLWLGREMGVNNLYYGKQFMKILAVCGPQGQIMHIIVHSHDVYNDWDILSESFLITRLNTGEYGDVVLLADENYPSHNHMEIPFYSPNDILEMEYNFSHFIIRYLTAQHFEALITRFPSLCHGMKPISPTHLDVVTACAILHNVCLRCQTPMPPTEIRQQDFNLHADIDQRYLYSYVTEE